MTFKTPARKKADAAEALRPVLKQSDIDSRREPIYDVLRVARNAAGEIIGVIGPGGDQESGKAALVGELGNVISVVIHPVTGIVTKYAAGKMIETTLSEAQYQALVSAGTVVQGCIYNVTA